MKRRICALCLAFALLFTALPIPARAVARRLPIYVGNPEADYLAEQLLAEISTAGLSDEQQILAVYDWIIANFHRNNWDGTYYFDQAQVALAAYGEFSKYCQQQFQQGKILLRRELKEESGTPPGYYDFTHFVMDSNSNIGSYAYEMILKRTGNCAHFSALFALLLSHLGYDSRMIHGEFINMDGSAVVHTWNYVLINGQYYWFDIRIDHQLVTNHQILEHSYFMEADTAVWAKEHNFDPEYSDWLAANAAAIQQDLDTAAVVWSGIDLQCSDWAREYMTRADLAGLIPGSMQAQDLTQPITRAEFAAVSVRLYEALEGTVIPAYPSATPFSDTADADVLRAYGMGIVNGMGDGTFAPASTLTREQAVTMLGRVYELHLTKAISGGVSLPQAGAHFLDHSLIQSYAVNYVYFFAGQGIVEGMGDGSFSPRSSMTREQALKVSIVTADSFG